MSNGDGSNSTVVSVVAILAILVLVGLVLYLVVFSPSEDGELDLDVNVDTIGQLRMQNPPRLAQRHLQRDHREVHGERVSRSDRRRSAPERFARLFPDG